MFSMIFQKKDFAKYDFPRFSKKMIFQDFPKKMIFQDFPKKMIFQKMIFKDFPKNDFPISMSVSVKITPIYQTIFLNFFG